MARLVLGLLMVSHGTQKLFGWFGGYGLAGTGGFFETLGFRPGRTFAAAASLACRRRVTLALTGSGLFSLDALLGLKSLWTPGIVWAAIAIGLIGGVVNLGLRRSAPQRATA